MQPIVLMSDSEYNMYYERMKEYMAKYGHFYPKNIRESITQNFLSHPEILNYSNCYLNEIYEMTGVFDIIPNNPYDRFFKELTKRFNIDGNLLDVACGFYPAFASRLAKIKQSGTIDAIDPNVIEQDISGVNIIKRFFNEKFDLRNYDLIYGIQPCEATFSMIKAAGDFDKDLFILPCDCGKIVAGRSMVKLDYKVWLKFAEQLLKQSTSSNREYKIEYTNSFKQPIIYTRKKAKRRR